METPLEVRNAVGKKLSAEDMLNDHRFENPSSVPLDVQMSRILLLRHPRLIPKLERGNRSLQALLGSVESG